MNTSHRSRTIGGYVAFRALETGWKSSCSNEIYWLLDVRFHCTDQESTSVSDDGAEASNSSSSKCVPGADGAGPPFSLLGFDLAGDSDSESNFSYDSLDHRTFLSRSNRFPSKCLDMKSNSRADVGKRILIAISLAKNSPRAIPRG
jgi:hypothetical protein